MTKLLGNRQTPPKNNLVLFQLAILTVTTVLAMGNNDGSNDGDHSGNDDGNPNQKVISVKGKSGNINIGDNKPTPNAMFDMTNQASSNLLRGVSNNLQETKKEKKTIDPSYVMKQAQPLDEANFQMGVEPEYEAARQNVLRAHAKDKDYVFNDTAFPATNRSVYFHSTSPKWRNIQWKRPKDISRCPQLMKDQETPSDIVQGQLEDRWFLNALSAISRIPAVIFRILHLNKSMTEDDYFGFLGFRFWRFGKWYDVIVDDKLPTRNGQLMFGRSINPDEFWVSFVEKAYAKIHGSYQALEGGHIWEALEDLTGGISTTYQLKDAPEHLFAAFVKAFKRDTLVCCSIEYDISSTVVPEYGYIVVDAKVVQSQKKYIPLVKIRCPHGGELTGDWSNRSINWRNVTTLERKRLGEADESIGETWMSYDEFKRCFKEVTLCAMSLDLGRRWNVCEARGSWIANGGGSINDVVSHAKNPQYYFHIREPDDFDPKLEGSCAKDRSSVVIGLMQEYRRIGPAEVVETQQIGFSVYWVKDPPTTRLSVEYFLDHRTVMQTSEYVKQRQVCDLGFFRPGHYILVPSTAKPNQVTSFLVRIFTQKEIELHELQ